MEIQTILTIAIIVILTLFLAGIYFFLYNYIKIQKEKIMLERRTREMELDLKHDEFYNLKRSRDKEENESRYIPRLMEEIPFLIEKSITKSRNKDFLDIERMIDSNLKEMNNKLSNVKASEDDNGNSKQLIREISHSLNTPFSLIEITVDNLIARENVEDDKLENLKTIKSSINICKSFLASFRELTLIASSSTIWNPESINDAVLSAANVYKQKNNKLNNVFISLPEKIDGFNNNYIISLLLPILENAIESATIESAVEVTYEKVENTIKLKVTNEPDALPKSNQIYDSGFTTKEKHDGLGLPIVKHLLESQSGSQLKHIVKGNILEFEIVLIGRK